jgi:RNA polymerase sigma-70 factor, ECF subfamily
MYTNNEEEYKDLKQEVSYQIIKSSENFKGESKLSTWVYKVSLFTALSFIKRKPKSYEQIDKVAEKITSESEFDEWNTVLEKIKTLPEMDKTLVFLYLEDKPYKDIAEIMGISESNVGVRLNRIKNKMKNYFIEQ